MVIYEGMYIQLLLLLHKALIMQRVIKIYSDPPTVVVNPIVFIGSMDKDKRKQKFIESIITHRVVYDVNKKDPNIFTNNQTLPIATRFIEDPYTAGSWPDANFLKKAYSKDFVDNNLS